MDETRQRIDAGIKMIREIVRLSNWVCSPAYPGGGDPLTRCTGALKGMQRHPSYNDQSFSAFSEMPQVRPL
jgi:hypothetical protein